MRRLFFMSLACACLSGCMATVNALSGNGPIAQARREKYLQAHPDDAYAASIRAGVPAVGMSLDDLQALYGSQCAVSNLSSAGTFYECHTSMLDDPYSPGMTILVDNTGHIASWVN